MSQFQMSSCFLLKRWLHFLHTYPPPLSSPPPPHFSHPPSSHPCFLPPPSFPLAQRARMHRPARTPPRLACKWACVTPPPPPQPHKIYSFSLLCECVQWGGGWEGMAGTGAYTTHTHTPSHTPTHTHTHTHTHPNAIYARCSGLQLGRKYIFFFA